MNAEKSLLNGISKIFKYSNNGGIMNNIIYQEELEAIMDAINESMKRFKDDPKSKATAADILREKGYTIKSLNIKDAENIVNLKRFLPRYFYLLKKDKKSDKQIKGIKKIIHDFIEKYKTGRVY
jgi:hypothetical protein